MNKKRLIIYLITTFIITWVPMFLFLSLGGKYDASKADTSLLCTYAMLCPAIATLITRWITKEGIGLVGDNSLRLGISFKHKKFGWYICAFIFPVCYWLIRDIIWFILQPGSFDVDMLRKYGYGNIGFIIIPIVGIVTAVAISFGALGEEIGWRGYMYRKLEELFGLKKAILIGGIDVEKINERALFIR